MRMCRRCGKPMRGHRRDDCIAATSCVAVSVSRTTACDTYENIIAIVRRAATHCFPDGKIWESGRTGSATAEHVCLCTLRDAIIGENSRYIFDLPAVTVHGAADDRSWWDFRVEGIPFNLKITSGSSADNALNKQGIISSITGHIHQPRTCSWAQFHRAISASPWPKQRDRSTEYHYLVINKRTGFMCVKSILDVWKYIPNCNLSNVLQINWRQERTYSEVTPESETMQKKLSLVQTIQYAVRVAIESVRGLTEFDFTTMAQVPQQGAAAQS